MAIRFPCGSCAQPIEVDEEWASKPVACPYCRTTITAPVESSLPQAREIPTASPAARGQPDTATSPFGSMQTDGRAASTHRCAVAALILVVLCAATFIAAERILAAHKEELKPLLESKMTGGSFKEISQLQAELFDAHGGPPMWLLGAGALMMTGGLLWLGTIVLGVIAVRGVGQRRLAVLALIGAGTIPLFLCCGGFAG